MERFMEGRTMDFSKTFKSIGILKLWDNSFTWFVRHQIRSTIYLFDKVKDHQKCLLNCLSQIRLGMSSKEVLQNENMKEIIDCDTYLKIEEKKTSSKKNELILQHVQRGGLASYHTFKTILQETRHFKLLDVLTKEERGITEEESDLWPRIASKSLKHCKKVIQSYLDPHLTLDEFEVNEFTDRINIRDIREQTTSTKKIDMIFSEVDKQGIAGYETLKTVLEDTSQTGVLESLQNAERDATRELVSTHDIVDDFICYSMAKSEIQSNIAHRHKSNANLQVFKVVRELATKFKESFKKENSTELINKLEADKVTLLTEILNDLFKDGVNWGRIVGAIAFAGAMGVILMSKDEVLVKTSRYLETHIGHWISAKGGWIAIIDFSKKNAKASYDELDTPVINNTTGDTYGRPAKRQKRHHYPAAGEIDNTASTINRPVKEQKSHHYPAAGEIDNTASTINRPAKEKKSHHYPAAGEIAKLLLSIAGGFILGVAVSKRLSK